MPEDSDRRSDIEVSLEDDTELYLETIEIDADDFPLSFSVEGEIRDIDLEIIDELSGNDLKPTAIRFQRVDGDE